MNNKHHIIRNFKKETNTIEKIFCNMLFQIGTTPIFFRKNLLNFKDYSKCKKLLRKGDIVLVGNLRNISSLFIRGNVTHSLMCVGYKRLIHAFADGVEEIKLVELFRHYDNLIILRPIIKKSDKNKIINKAVNFLKSKIGSPYNFTFRENNDSYFCTQIIDDTFNNAGFKLGFDSKNKYSLPLMPGSFLKSDKFVEIYHSEYFDNKKL